MNAPPDKVPELFDPGCQKATLIFDEVSGIPKEDLDASHMAPWLIVETHREHTTKHPPDCFVNRPVH
ncbi:MAG: hypothetical protein HW405_237 [Candidatus Berkelbacteria bacterium]|nr:hypothetical protein [Candidatus Berkelbacteria bacterium]